MRVLEIATGTGLIAIHIAKHVHSVEATDFSTKMIDAAKKKKAPENVHFSVEDGENLSFGDHSFIDPKALSEKIMSEAVRAVKEIMA